MRRKIKKRMAEEKEGKKGTKKWKKEGKDSLGEIITDYFKE